MKLEQFSKEYNMKVVTFEIGVPKGRTVIQSCGKCAENGTCKIQDAVIELGIYKDIGEFGCISFQETLINTPFGVTIKD